MINTGGSGSVRVSQAARDINTHDTLVNGDKIDSVDGGIVTANTLGAESLKDSTLNATIVVGSGVSIQSSNYNNGWARFHFTQGNGSYAYPIVGSTIGFFTPPDYTPPPPNRGTILQIDLLGGSWNTNNATGWMYISIVAGSGYWGSEHITILGTYLGNYGNLCTADFYYPATTPSGWILRGDGYSQINQPL